VTELQSALCPHGAILQVADAETQPAVLAKLAVLTVGPAFCATVILNTSVSGLYRVRTVFYRERAARLYSPEAHVLSLIVRELPWYGLFSLIVTVCAYFLFGFRLDLEAIFTFWLGLTLLFAYYGAIAIWISGMSLKYHVVAAVCAGFHSEMQGCRIFSFGSGGSGDQWCHTQFTQPVLGIHGTGV
jgi:hypothetical protein